MTDPSQIKNDIEAVLKDIDKLPSLPGVANHAISLAYDPDVDIKVLAEEISHDPAITAAVIKLSNSAYFAPSKQIRSVQEAIMTLGLNIVKDIIIIAASQGILKQDLDGYKIEGVEIWDHSLLVAELSSRIARLKKTKTRPDVAFTAGLFHDVGKIVMSTFFKRIQRQIIMEMEKNPESRFTELERRHMGYSHDQLGGLLLRQWKLPRDLVEAVYYQYHPDKAKINPELCSIVHIANIVALASGVGIDVGGLSEELKPRALQIIGLTDRELESMYNDLPEIMEHLEDMRRM